MRSPAFATRVSGGERERAEGLLSRIPPRHCAAPANGGAAHRFGLQRTRVRWFFQSRIRRVAGLLLVRPRRLLLVGFFLAHGAALFFAQ